MRCAWTLLVKRVLLQSFNGFTEVGAARHCIPEEAAAVSGRMKLLQGMHELQRSPFPNRLRARVHAAALWADDWATQDVRKGVDAWVAGLSAQAADWLAALPPLAPIDLAQRPVVLIVDALAPDVWLEASTAFGPLLQNATQNWSRLSSVPQTVPALNALFGFSPDRDPLEEFIARGVAYESVKGDEGHALVELVAPLEKNVSRVIRFSLLDNAAHEVTLPLPSLPSTVRTLLARHVPGVMSVCAAQKRPLILTADHGLSWKGGRLSHGKGGVFEEAVPRIEWRE